VSFFSGGRFAQSLTLPHDHSAPAYGGSYLGPDQLVADDADITALAIDNSIRLSDSATLELGNLLTDSISANQNNYDPTGAGNGWHYLQLTVTGSRNITGIDSGFTGLFTQQPCVIAIQLVSGTVTFKDASGSSSVVNRFGLGADLALTGPASVAFIYDVTALRWRLLWLGSPSSSSLPNHTHSSVGDGGSTLDPADVMISAYLVTSGVYDIGAMAGPVDDAPIGAVAVVTATPTGALRALRGMVATQNYQRVAIINESATQVLQINHEATGSAAANRFYCPAGANYALSAYSAVEVIYDGAVNRWRLLGGSA